MLYRLFVEAEWMLLNDRKGFAILSLHKRNGTGSERVEYTVDEQRYNLVCAIERILAGGGDARVTTCKDGVVVYEQRVKKKYVGAALANIHTKDE